MDDSTGFRWYVPQPPAFWPLLRSVWNGILLEAMLRPNGCPLAWPRASAVRKTALGRTRLRIAFAPGAMVADESQIGAAGFLRGAAREMALAGFQAPRLWWAGLFTHALNGPWSRNLVWACSKAPTGRPSRKRCSRNIPVVRPPRLWTPLGTWVMLYSLPALLRYNRKYANRMG